MSSGGTLPAKRYELVAPERGYLPMLWSGSTGDKLNVDSMLYFCSFDQYQRDGRQRMVFMCANANVLDIWGVSVHDDFRCLLCVPELNVFAARMLPHGAGAGLGLLPPIAVYCTAKTLTFTSLHRVAGMPPRTLHAATDHTYLGTLGVSQQHLLFVTSTNRVNRELGVVNLASETLRFVRMPLECADGDAEGSIGAFALSRRWLAFASSATVDAACANVAADLDRHQPYLASVINYMSASDAAGAARAAPREPVVDVFDLGGDPAQPRLLARFLVGAAGRAVSLLRWDPSGRLLAVCLAGGYVDLYRLRPERSRDPTQAATLVRRLWRGDRSNADVCALEFSPDSRLLALQTRDKGSVRLFAVDAADLAPPPLTPIDLACAAPAPSEAAELLAFAPFDDPPAPPARTRPPYALRFVALPLRAELFPAHLRALSAPPASGRGERGAYTLLCGNYAGQVHQWLLTPLPLPAAAAAYAAPGADGWRAVRMYKWETRRMMEWNTAIHLGGEREREEEERRPGGWMGNMVVEMHAEVRPVGLGPQVEVRRRREGAGAERVGEAGEAGNLALETGAKNYVVRHRELSEEELAVVNTPLSRLALTASYGDY